MRLFDGNSEFHMPTDRFPVSETLEWGVQYGGHLCGTGAILADSEHRANLGTRVVHEFDKSQPTLRYQGFGGSIDRVTFTGDSRLANCPREDYAACGVLFDKAPDSGFGTGKLSMGLVSFTQYKRAIQMGFIEPGQSPSSEENSDQLLIWRIHTNHCDVMLRIEHEQGVDPHITYARPYKTPLVFDIEGGGNLSCASLRCMSGVNTVLRTGQGVGSNNAKFVIGEGGTVVVDTNNEVPVFLKQDKRAAAMEVSFHNVRTGNNSPWPSHPVFQLKGGTRLTINGFKSLKGGSIEFINSIVQTYKNHVHLQNATTGITDLAALFSPTSRGECWVTVGAVTSVYGVTTIPPGMYRLSATSQGVTVVERPSIVDVSDIMRQLTDLQAAVDALANDGLPPADLEPLESRVGLIEESLPAIEETASDALIKADAALTRNSNLDDQVSSMESTVESVNERIDAIGTAFQQVAKDLLPVDDGGERL